MAERMYWVQQRAQQRGQQSGASFVTDMIIFLLAYQWKE